MSKSGGSVRMRESIFVTEYRVCDVSEGVQELRSVSSGRLLCPFALSGFNQRV